MVDTFSATLPPAPGSFRSRSPGYAGFKAMLLSLAARNAAGPFRDAVRGHADLVRQTNIHDSLVGLCSVSGGDEDGRILWSTPGGDLWSPRGASAKYVAGIVAEQVVDSYHHSSMPSWAGQVVIDCGANIGVFSRQAVRNGTELVIAIEPSRENALCFRRNLAADIASGRVILLETAVGDREGRLWLDTSNTANPGSWSVSANSGMHGHSVEMTTVDRIAGKYRPKRVGMIKIDVEGCELAVIRGAITTLEQHRPSFAVAVEHANEYPADIIPAIGNLQGVRGVYHFRCGFYRCDESRRLVPQIVYFIPRKPVAGSIPEREAGGYNAAGEHGKEPQRNREDGAPRS